MRNVDLVVIGGGPAGTSAAITAARLGTQVALLEAGRFPRHKVCGEFVSAESLEPLRDLLDSDHSELLISAMRVSQGRLFVDGRILSTAIEPAAASIARFDLDSALWVSALKAGVQARQQAKVLKIAGSGPFLIKTQNDDFEARAVVNATGRWSNLQRMPRPEAHAGEKWIGLKAHFAEPSPPASVDLYFFLGGYCGVQPVILSGEESLSRVNACAMVRADTASTLAEVFALHPELRDRSRHWAQVSDPVSVSPLFFGVPRTVQDNMLRAGDAAGFVDPFVGDGISLALRSGALAAECLHGFFTEKISLAEAADEYAFEYERRFAGIFRSSSWLRKSLLLPRSLRVALITILQTTPWATKYLVRKTR
jgi:menaquinone-9 beta-reductase